MLLSRLQNLEVRAGTKNDLTNEIMGTFTGPGKTGEKHVVQFKRPVLADYLTLQLKKKSASLQVNGIYLNEKDALGDFGKNKSRTLLSNKSKNFFENIHISVIQKINAMFS